MKARNRFEVKFSWPWASRSESRPIFQPALSLIPA
jgi:hypothetical protein